MRGFCRPLTAANLHIRTLYSDGTEEVGQHLMNKMKEGTCASTGSRSRTITDIDLVESLDANERQDSQDCHIDIVSSDHVASADLIVFPMGSFFASILVNLLPNGVGRAIVRRKCPKVYVPNTGCDPEMAGYALAECVQRIIDMVRQDHIRNSPPHSQAADIPVNDILNFVVLDTVNCQYSVQIDKAIIAELGVVVIDVPLIDLQETSAENGRMNTRIDPSKIAEVLVSLAS